MFRNQVRRGIRAVRDGHPPAGLCRDEGTVIPTYCNNTVVHMPPSATDTEDKKMMRETGLKLAKSYLKNPPLIAGR